MDVGLVPALRDGALRDRAGLLLGRVEDQLFDAGTNRPAWLVVRLSDGGARTLVPAAGVRARVDGLQIGVGAELVRSCPVALAGRVPLREHVAAAARHYGLRRFARGAAGASYTSAAPALGVAA
ncbi:MAG TPA: hypothetical protein VI318_04075 [Baekduia sp.]